MAQEWLGTHPPTRSAMSTPSHHLPLLAAGATFCALLFIAFSSNASETPSRQEIYRLAGEPEARVENGVCHIRGAFWRNGYGPVSDRAISIDTLDGKQLAVVRTDKRGVYETSVALPEGKGQVLIEGDVFETGISAGIRRSIEIKRNGGSTRKANVEHPKIACVKPVVSIGELTSLLKAPMEMPR